MEDVGSPGSSESKGLPDRQTPQQADQQSRSPSSRSGEQALQEASAVVQMLKKKFAVHQAVEQQAGATSSQAAHCLGLQEAQMPSEGTAHTQEAQAQGASEGMSITFDVRGVNWAHHMLAVQTVV